MNLRGLEASEFRLLVNLEATFEFTYAFRVTGRELTLVETFTF